MVDHHPYRLEFARQTYNVFPINFDEVDPAEVIIENTAFRGVDADKKEEDCRKVVLTLEHQGGKYG
jgi:hypothetical protein